MPLQTYQMTQCTDAFCTRSNPCESCRGQGNRVLKDGEGVRVRMIMMDSVQRDLAARFPNTEVTDSESAYAAMCRDLDYRTRGQEAPPATVSDAGHARTPADQAYAAMVRDLDYRSRAG